MAYKKPQMVAKSAPKKSYVAGCPSKTFWNGGYNCGECADCEIVRKN